MKKEKFTVETLKAKYDEPGFNYPQDIIYWARNQYPDYVFPPKKPEFSPTTAKEAESFFHEMEAYETAKLEWDKAEKGRKRFELEIRNAIEEFMKEESGLNKHVPEKYRDKVWAKAEEYGHSSGFSEVYSCLLDLVEIFK